MRDVHGAVLGPDAQGPVMDGEDVGEEVVDGPPRARGRGAEVEVGGDEPADLVGGTEQGGAGVVHDVLHGLGGVRGGGRCAAHALIRSRKATHIR